MTTTSSTADTLDLEPFSVAEPLIGSKVDVLKDVDDEEVGYEFNEPIEESTDGKWYPDEYYLFEKIPLARSASLLFWYYELVWGGIAFIYDYVCTTGMRICFWTAIILSTIFIHYSLFNRKNMPLTYTWAKGRGCGVIGCVLYSLYNGAVAAITAWFTTFAGIWQILTFEEIWDWNC